MYFDNIIILTGHRKSGTTMFHRLFDGHPDIYIYPVDLSLLYAYFPHFTLKLKSQPAALKARLHLVISTNLQAVEDHLISEKGFSAHYFADEVCRNLEDKYLDNKEVIISTVANCWIRMYYQSDQVKPFLFKETSQSIYIQEYLQFSVKIKIVSLVRDPRDNYAAIKAGVADHYSKMNENELESLASVINRARMDLLSAKYNNDSLENFLAVKFENLVLEPEKNLQNITKFLNVHFTDSLLQPTSFGKLYKGNNYEGKKFKGISNANLGNWKSRINESEAKIIEYWLADVMERWEYKPAFTFAESEAAFSEFYNWYNVRYFYRDGYKILQNKKNL